MLRLRLFQHVFSSFNARAGTDASHPDIPCLPLDDPSTNCIGKSYTQSRDEEWFRPSSSHGTHVVSFISRCLLLGMLLKLLDCYRNTLTTAAVTLNLDFFHFQHGTIGALGNGFGVRGVLHDYGVCYIVTRVFGRGGSFEDTSVLFDAIQWTVDRGAKVINMSLGGVGYSLAGERAYRRWRNQDVLFVVAAGNDGKEGFPTTMYPAAYPGVLSVAAVDFTGEKADFSSFNEGKRFENHQQPTLRTDLSDVGSLRFSLSSLLFSHSHLKQALTSLLPGRQFYRQSRGA